MEKTLGKRGFVTIATGDKRYFDLAVNLLHSYHFHTKDPYPFAIICDRENEVTAEFDAVIIIDDPSRNYMDKLRLYEFMPWDETIFIDADSLAYGDLNAWWDMFSAMGDFSVFGYASRDLKTAKRWFRPDGIKEFASQVTFVPDFNGGVYYLRNTETCKRVFEIAQYCADHYHDYSFTGFYEPADEPVLALAMAVCGCEPLNVEELLFAPRRRNTLLDISKGIAKKKNKSYSFRLVHWSNYLTMKSQYRFEVAKLIHMIEGRKSFLRQLLYEDMLAYGVLWVYDVNALLFRIIRKFRKEWRKWKRKKACSFS